ncbi:MAG: acetate kinase [Bacilli bacterium]|nr:acetate kinase [Bacilli bacterium]
MEDKYLIINAGSSSLKFTLYEMPSAKEIVNGYVQKIGEGDSFYELKYNGKKDIKEKDIKNHSEAVETMLNELLENKFITDIDEIKGVGHRVLHGGEFYSKSTLIDQEVLNNIKALTKLGPLHHPGEIAGIEGMMEVLKDVPQVAVFDTAFHQTMPKENYLYAVPYSWYKENGVRKYGFHGTSHNYITSEMKKYFNKDDINLIICHIGSGASIACIKNGVCYDTTMGLTPLDGLIMGTRSGSIDPSIIEYVAKERQMTVEEVIEALNKESGLLGIAGKNDYRDLSKANEEGDEKANLALKMFYNSVTKFIAEYYFKLDGKVDALVFTAGIGENAKTFRKEIMDRISKPMNIKLNEKVNDEIPSINREGKISTDDSACEVLVVPTNEEYMIAKDILEITKKTNQD